MHITNMKKQVQHIRLTSKDEPTLASIVRQAYYTSNKYETYWIGIYRRAIYTEYTEYKLKYIPLIDSKTRATNQ